MCRKTIYDARNNFSALIKVAESGEPVELTRHDKPVAVIINWEEYEKKCISGKSIPNLSVLRKIKEKEDYEPLLENSMLLIEDW